MYLQETTQPPDGLIAGKKVILAYFLRGNVKKISLFFQEVTKKEASRVNAEYHPSLTTTMMSWKNKDGG